MNRVFVTGGSGFIGGHLVQTLVQRGVHVRCLVRPHSNATLLRECGAELIQGDLSQPRELVEAIRGSDVVFHLAGAIKTVYPQDMVRANAAGAEAVARACAEQSRPPVMIHVSSLAAAGTSPTGIARTESDPPAPISRYGRSKLAGELAVARYADAVPVTILRPGIVFGPRDENLLEMYRPIARIGVHVVPRFYPPRLSLIYVDDLVELMIRAVDQGRRVPPPHGQNGDSAAGRYFACAAEYPNYIDLGRMIGRTVGRPSVLMIYLPEAVLLAAAGAAELWARAVNQAVVLNLDKIREATAGSWVGSAELARRELGFAPPADLEQRLRQTAAWYREHRRL